MRTRTVATLHNSISEELIYFYPPMKGEVYKCNWDDHEEAYRSDQELREKLEACRNVSFEKLSEKFKELDFCRLMRSSNARLEDLDKFHLQRNWSELMSSLDIETDRFFSAWFIFDVSNVDRFHELVSYIPQYVLYNFRLTRAYIYLPESDNRSVLDSDDDEYIFELTLSIHPAELSNKFIAREKLNEYFDLIIDGINEFQSKCY